MNPRKTTKENKQAKQRPRASVKRVLQAGEGSHEFITVEHLLLALLDDPAGFESLVSPCQRRSIKGDLAEFIDATTPMVLVKMRSIHNQPGFQRVLQQLHVQSSGKAEVTGANVLVAIFSGERRSLPQDAGYLTIDIVNYITHLCQQIRGREDGSGDEFAASGDSADAADEEESPLAKYATN